MPESDDDRSTKASYRERLRIGLPHLLRPGYWLFFSAMFVPLYFLTWPLHDIAHYELAGAGRLRDGLGRRIAFRRWGEANGGRLTAVRYQVRMGPSKLEFAIDPTGFPRTEYDIHPWDLTRLREDPARVN